jgi:hypothetical protein
MANAIHLQATLDAVLAHPEHWSQRMWHCGTSHCFAGFAEMIRLGESVEKRCSLASYQPSTDDASLAQEGATRMWLGLDREEWMSITNALNTMEELQERVCEVIQRSKETTE